VEPGDTGRWRCTVTARANDVTYVRIYASPYFDTPTQASAYLILQLDKARRIHPDSNFYRWVDPPPPWPDYVSLNQAMADRIERYESGRWDIDTTDYLRMYF